MPPLSTGARDPAEHRSARAREHGSAYRGAVAPPRDPRDPAGDDASPSAGDAADEPAPRLTLVVRPGCHLCGDARETVRRVAGETGTRWREVSLDGDVELTARYGELVPVVLVDGAQHTFHRVDAERLREALVGDAAEGPAWLRRWSRRRGV